MVVKTDQSLVICMLPHNFVNCCLPEKHFKLAIELWGITSAALGQKIDEGT